MFTADPSDYINNRADSMNRGELEQAFNGLFENMEEKRSLLDTYLNHKFDSLNHTRPN